MCAAPDHDRLSEGGQISGDGGGSLDRPERPLTLLVAHHGPRRSWHIDLAPLHQYISRVLLVENGSGAYLLPVLRKALPACPVDHLPLAGDDPPGEWNRGLRDAMEVEGGWVLLLPAGCGVLVDRHFSLPDQLAPFSLLHRRQFRRVAVWRPALLPAGEGCLSIDTDGSLRVDAAFNSGQCHPGMVIVEQSTRSVHESRKPLDAALAACRSGAGAEADLDAAERLFGLGRFQEANFWYRRCLADGIDGAERWTALYHRACCLLETGSSWAVVEAALAEAFDENPDRAEPLYHLARHYLESGDNRKAFELAAVGVGLGPPRTPQPFEYPVYQYELPRVYMAAALALGRNVECVREANRTLRRSGLPEKERDEIAGLRSRAVAHCQPVLPLSIRRRNRIVVISAFRNAGAFLRRCMDSLVSQDYPRSRFILIDDASTDGALDDAEVSDPRFTVIRNPERRGAIRNQLDAIKEHCGPEDIVVYVDGDDRLIDDGALSYINDFFNSTRCLVMYGQYRDSRERYGRCEPIVETGGSVLDAVGPMHFPMHVRAHRAALVERLEEIDPALHRLRDDGGEFLDAVADMAVMRAIMQLAGLERIRYNDRILYEYNAGNPESHYRAVERRQLQDRQARILHSRPPLPQVGDRNRAAVPVCVQDSAKARLLLVALDGITPRLIRKWAVKGHLPALAKLLKSDHVRDITVPRGFGNDACWTSFSTGVLPDEHGYYFRNRWCPAEHGLKFCDLENELGGETFWEQQADTDLEMAIIDMPEVKHAGRVNGLEVTDWVTHARLGPPRFFPAGLKEDWVGRFGVDPTGGNTETMATRTGRQFVKLRDQLLATVEQKTRAALHCLDRGGWDLFALAYTQGHDVGHQFWHVHDPAHPAHRPIWRERYGDPLLQMYQAIDRGLGRLIDRAGDGTRVMVVAGLAMEAKVSCSAVLDEILWAIEQAVFGGYESHVTRRDLKQRRFFAVPHNNLSGTVRLNLQGRETAAGLVKQGDEYRRTLDVLQDCLGRVVNADTGEPVVGELVRTQEVYSGSRVDDLPDLFVIWNRSSPIRRITSPWFDEIALRPKGVTDTRSGDHVGKAEMITNFEPPFPGSGPVPVQDIASVLVDLVKAGSGLRAGHRE